MLLQNYLASKKNMLCSSKSQYFQPVRETDRQTQRKLTYNMLVGEE